MTVVLTSTPRAVEPDVGNGSCRCLRLYNKRVTPIEIPVASMRS